MKMPTLNFDFGPFTESGVVALSPYGIAVRSSKGEYLTYNAATGATIAVALTLIALFISTIGLASVYIGADASVAKWETQYESLTYQLENNLYDNDNDIGKKELMDEIREWNEDLAYCKKIQRNFWVGIYYPNVYDNLEFIPLP